MKTYLLQCWENLRDYVAFLMAPPIIRWRSGEVSEGVKVSYGYPSLPKDEDKTGGGIIKLQDLARHFPECFGEASILYLVSSALPPNATIMVRQAKKAGVKVVVNQNGVAYQGWHGDGWERTNRPLRLVLQHADYVFYQSEFCKKGADLFLCTAKGGHEILYNAVDTSVFRPCKKGVGRLGSRTLLVAGSHCHFYRVRCALQTLALLRNTGCEVNLLIAGRLAWHEDEAASRAELEDLIRGLDIKDRVEFTGAYSQTEAVALFNRADILLHTKYNDPCPRVVLEAMACGLPVVYSASGGMPELVGEDAGKGVPAPFDWQVDHPPAPEGLAKAVMGIMANYDACSENARKRAVSLFDVEPWVARHHEVFTRLVVSRP